MAVFTLSSRQLPELPATLRLDSNGNMSCIVKVVLSCSPSLTEGFTAIGLLYRDIFSFFKQDSFNWEILNWGKDRLKTDAVYMNRSFFVVDNLGCITIIDIDSLNMTLVEMAPIFIPQLTFNIDETYLVVLEGNVLWLFPYLIMIGKGILFIGIRLLGSKCLR